MASDSTHSNTPSASATPRACDKVRLRFRKVGELRLVSHRDLMRCFERALRRANLPIHVSQGFHPMPRMVFAMSLGLGIQGLEEVLELELTELVEPEDVLQRLAAQLPQGLDLISAKRIPVRSASLVRRAGYRSAIPAHHMSALPGRIAEFLATQECWIERDRPERRRFDLRPYISEINLNDDHLEMLLWVTPNGAARPGEVLAVLGLSDLLDDGAILERHRLELHDETEHCDPLAQIPAKGGHESPLAPAKTTPSTAADDRSRPTALVAGPMSFDS